MRAFTRAVAAEWVKLFSLRSTAVTLIASAGLTVGVAVLVAVTGSLAPDESVRAGALGNAAPGLLATGAFGALVSCGEYGSTIRLTLTACPRRWLILAAKVLLATVTAAVVAVIGAVVAYLAAAAVLAGRGHPAGDPLPAVLGVAVLHAAVAGLGVAAGVALRHSGGAITAVMAVVLLPVLLSPLLGAARATVTAVSPIGVLAGLATGPTPADASGGWAGLAVLIACTTGALALSGWLFNRRDA